MRSGNPCLGCGCNGRNSSGYCSFCESNVCSVCNCMDIKSEFCIQCRRASGSKE